MPPDARDIPHPGDELIEHTISLFRGDMCEVAI